jgi:3-oxoacyl-(acyl-carrier-protein) synthase
MNKRRVVITGMGVVSPIGLTLNEYWENSLNGKSGIKKINLFDIPENMASIAGMVDEFVLDSMRVDLPYSEVDRSTLFALHATKEALSQANIDYEDINNLGSRMGLVISSAVGQIISMERVFRERTKNGAKSLEFSTTSKSFSNPFAFNAVIDELIRAYKIAGRSVLLPTGCAGGVDAISYSVHNIRMGHSDVVVTGATEAPITPLVVSAFNKLGATSTRYNNNPESASRPFDKDRDGFVLAEGCGILILEELEHALKRNARILAEVVGVGSVNNYSHMTDIPQDGMPIAKASMLAIEEAGIVPEDIDFINSHGSSTPQNDVAETNAFKYMFKNKYKRIPVTSNKSLQGHALAASNALEVISSVLSLLHNKIPPTINVNNQDPNCDLDVVKDYPRNLPIEYVLKTSSGFSGIHSSLVLKRRGTE